MTKPTKWRGRTAKTQISLDIRQVWSESSLCAQWVAKDPNFLHVDCKDSDQTGHFVGFAIRWLYWYFPVSILYKSIAGRYRPVSYPDGPITVRYWFIKNAFWELLDCS